MARQRFDDTDVRRGERFKEICGSLFPKHSRDSIGRRLGGFSGTTVRNWEAGNPIANAALASIMTQGASIEYILSGDGPKTLPLPKTQQKAIAEQYRQLPSPELEDMIRTATPLHDVVEGSKPYLSETPADYTPSILEHLRCYLPDISIETIMFYFGMDEEKAENIINARAELSSSELAYFRRLYNHIYAGLNIDTDWILEFQFHEEKYNPVFSSISCSPSMNGEPVRFLGIYADELLFLSNSEMRIIKMPVSIPYPTYGTTSIVPIITWQELMQVIPNAQSKAEWEIIVEMEHKKEFHYRSTNLPTALSAKEIIVESQQKTSPTELIGDDDVTKLFSSLTANYGALSDLVESVMAGKIDPKAARQAVVEALDTILRTHHKQGKLDMRKSSS